MGQRRAQKLAGVFAMESRAITQIQDRELDEDGLGAKASLVCELRSNPVDNWMPSPGSLGACLHPSAR